MDTKKLAARTFALDAIQRLQDQDGYGLKSVARQMVTEYFANPAHKNFGAFNEARSWLGRPERTPEQQALGRALYDVSFEVVSSSMSFDQAAALLAGIKVKAPSDELRAKAVASIISDDARNTEGPAGYIAKAVCIAYLKEMPDQQLWPLNLAIDDLLRGDSREQAIGRAMSSFLQFDVLDGNRRSPQAAAALARAGEFG